MPVLQPLAILPGTKPLTEFESEVVAHNDGRRPGVNAYYQDSFEAFGETLVQLGVERPDLLVMDATRVFAATDQIAFTDHCHLTPLGRRVLAAAIGERLLARLDASESPAASDDV